MFFFVNCKIGKVKRLGKKLCIAIMISRPMDYLSRQFQQNCNKMGQEIPKNAATGHDDKQDILVLQTSASACHNIFRRLTSKHLSLPPDPDPANSTILLVANHASPAESGRHQAIQNVTTKLSHFLFRVGSNGKKNFCFF